MKRPTRATSYPTFTDGLCVVEHGRDGAFPVYWARYAGDGFEGGIFTNECPLIAAARATAHAVTVAGWRKEVGDGE